MAILAIIWRTFINKTASLRLVELTENDKKLVEHLFYDARRSTRELARIIGIKQPSVHARMKKLEAEGFLSRYDSLITTHMFPFIHKVYYCSLSATEVEAIVAMPSCFILQEVYGQYTHQVSCFFPNEQQRIACEKKLPKKRIEHAMTKSHLLGGTIFDVKREQEAYTRNENISPR